MMTDKKEGPNIKQVNWDGRTIFLEETFKGCVIRIFEKNGYDDSDFFATVWNEEKQQFENIEYSTTRAWCYPNNAIVDATPEIQTKWDIMCRESEQKRRKAMIENEKHIPRIGKNVQVVKGRKVPTYNVKFAKFTDPTEGIKKHFSVLMADRYKNARLNAKSPEEQIKMLVQAGYSTQNPTTYVNLMKGNISRVRKLLPFGRIA